MNAGSDPFQIRRATPEDAEAICRMHCESIRMLCAGHYTPAQIEAWAGGRRPAQYVEAIKQGEFMIVAETDGHIVGFGALRGGVMRAVYVAPSQTRRGIGRSILKELEREAERNGELRVTLNSTLTAVGFYESHGYVRGERTAHRRSGVDIPCVSMSKKLGSP